MYICCSIPPGDKLPWSVKMDNFSVYSVHRSDTVHHLLKPSSLCSTVAVTTKYRLPAADSLSLLGLCIHGDMQSVEVVLVAKQVCILTFWNIVDAFGILLTLGSVFIHYSFIIKVKCLHSLLLSYFS